MTQSITRRRFLILSAAAIATPARATPLRWQGLALGAQVSLTIHAPRPQAEQALRDIRRLLARIEHLFSLYDPASQLSRLNAVGKLADPAPEFTALLHQSGRVHDATRGLFDPTIQPLWQALAGGGDRAAARALVGWEQVRIGAGQITLGADQALTLNGIAQGFATDLARKMLKQAGLEKVLVNLGEFGALGGPFTLGISDPVFGLAGTVRLSDRAIATSSPGAMTLAANQGHILHPITDSAPQWSTVSVEADSAAIADAASTAFCLMSKAEIRASLRHLPGRTRATLVDHSGTVHKTG